MSRSVKRSRGWSASQGRNGQLAARRDNCRSIQATEYVSRRVVERLLNRSHEANERLQLSHRNRFETRNEEDVESFDESIILEKEKACEADDARVVRVRRSVGWRKQHEEKTVTYAPSEMVGSAGWWKHRKGKTVTHQPGETVKSGHRGTISSLFGSKKSTLGPQKKIDDGMADLATELNRRAVFDRDSARLTDAKKRAARTSVEERRRQTWNKSYTASKPTNEVGKRHGSPVR